MPAATILTSDAVAPLEALFNVGNTALNADIATINAGAGRGTVANYSVTNLAALDALTTAVIGDTAFMTTPGTGITALNWQAFAGTTGTIDWRIIDAVVQADTLTNLNTFIAAVVAISGTDTQFKVGNLAHTTGTGVYYIFTSTAGLKRALGSSIPLLSTNVAGAGSGTPVVMGANGVITCVAATRIDLTLFSAEFDIYDFEITSDTVTDIGFTVQLRLGTGSAVATGYDYKAAWDLASARTINPDGVNLTNFLASPGNTGTRSHLDLTIVNPFKADSTRFYSHFEGATVASGANMIQGDASGSQRNSTSYDGVVLTPNAAFTGTIRPRARNNG